MPLWLEGMSFSTEEWLKKDEMRYIVDYMFKSRMAKLEPKPPKRFEVSWRDTDIDSLEFLHKEASVRVQDTVKDHYEASKKAFSLLLLMITISSILGGYLVKSNTWSNSAVVSLVALIVLLIAIYVLSELIRPNTFRAPGRMPKRVLIEKVYKDPQVGEADRKKLIIYHELINCQAQIELNQFYNTVRLRIIDFVIRLVLISFVTLAILLLVLHSSS